MRNETRLAFNGYLAQVAALSAVASAAQAFTVAPTVQQTLETKIQENSAFLKSINIVGVRDLEGEKLGLGINGPIASRTNTANGERQTRETHNLDARGYKCEKTNYDTHIKYATLDMWSKFPDFQARVRDNIIQRQALDRILIGFHGTAAAPDTNLAANPLLQDVNKGWLHHLRTDSPDRVLTEAKPGSHKVKVGKSAGNDYFTLDALVFDALQLLDPWYREDPALRVILGRGLMHDKFHNIINVDQTAENILASDILMSQKLVGGLPAVTVPYFPDNAILITRLDNLSIYYQDSARRRYVIDNPKRDRIENFESSNDAYVIEQVGLAAMVENIEVEAAAPAP